MARTTTTATRTKLGNRERGGFLRTRPEDVDLEELFRTRRREEQEQTQEAEQQQQRTPLLPEKPATGFERFLERGLALAGSRRGGGTDRATGAVFGPGWAKGLTKGQAIEKARGLYSNLDDSVRQKFERQANLEDIRSGRERTAFAEFKQERAEALGIAEPEPPARTDIGVKPSPAPGFTPRPARPGGTIDGRPIPERGPAIRFDPEGKRLPPGQVPKPAPPIRFDQQGRGLAEGALPLPEEANIIGSRVTPTPATPSPQPTTTTPSFSPVTTAALAAPSQPAGVTAAPAAPAVPLGTPTAPPSQTAFPPNFPAPIGEETSLALGLSPTTIQTGVEKARQVGGGLLSVSQEPKRIGKSIATGVAKGLAKTVLAKRALKERVLGAAQAVGRRGAEVGQAIRRDIGAAPTALAIPSVARPSPPASAENNFKAVAPAPLATALEDEENPSG